MKLFGRVRRGVAAGALALSLAVAAGGSATAQLLAPVNAPPVEAFAHLPAFKDIAISPDGTMFAALVNIEERYVLGVFDYTGGDLKTLYMLKESDEHKLRDPRWASNERLLFTMQYGARRWRTDTVETRLTSMRPDGSDMFNMYRYAEAETTVQIQDRIVSMLPDDPDHILVEYGVPNAGVYRANVTREAGHDRVQRPMAYIRSWTADVHGNVRVGWGVVKDREEKLMIKLSDGDWKVISHRVAPDAPDFNIIGVAEGTDMFYAVMTDPATGTNALYLYDGAADALREQIFVHPTADVYGIEQDNETGRVVGVHYAEDEGQIEWLEDTAIEENLDQLQKVFPGHSVSIASINMPETRAVVMIDKATVPGFYLLFDMVGKAAITLPPQYPALAESPLGEVVVTRYEARDGLTIPAYVTLPPGLSSLEAAAGLPFVMMPHGGPTARDFRGFDYWAQFLASRGYGVLQMNFRGSAGYGEDFRRAGDRQWGQAMQDDITDGAQWLIANGHADPDRLAIMGGSYGGYAALMGAVVTPGLYQCAVSFAGVTDLPGLLWDARDFVNGRYYNRHIGNLWSDRRMLQENSPYNRVDDITVPILLMHGDEDRVVDPDQSKKMADRLRTAGKDVTYIELPKGDHHLSIYANRLRFLQETERFLGDCLD